MIILPGKEIRLKIYMNARLHSGFYYYIPFSPKTKVENSFKWHLTPFSHSCLLLYAAIHTIYPVCTQDLTQNIWIDKYSKLKYSK